ncbi:MAG TPA: AI-2E family transporter [Steroidobacteraceae bacterium]|nr:AI-2E family transporter [Steroidobacteraceae bacterium]
MSSGTFYARAFAIALALGLGYALWQIFSPFLSAITWAAFLALLLYPANAWLRRRIVGGRTGAAAVVTALTPVMILAPVTFLAITFVSQARALLALLREAAQRYQINSLDDLQQFPAAARFFAWLESSVGVSVNDVQTWLVEHAQELLQRLAGLGGSVFLGALGTLVGFLLMLFVLFFFLRDGDGIVKRARALIPFPPERKQHLVEHLVAVTRAVVYGIGVTAIAQGVMVGIGFWVTGLPSPVVFGALAALLAMVPVGGTVLIWLPGVLWLGFGANRWGWAIALFVWGIIISMLDNVLRPLLISGRAEVSTLAVFLGVLGGLSAFGPIGLVLGPVLLSLVIALLRFVEDEQKAQA